MSYFIRFEEWKSWYGWWIFWWICFWLWI